MGRQPWYWEITWYIRPFFGWGGARSTFQGQSRPEQTLCSRVIYSVLCIWLRCFWIVVASEAKEQICLIIRSVRSTEYMYIPCSGMLGYALMHCTRIQIQIRSTYSACTLSSEYNTSAYTTRHACMYGVVENKLKGILNPINGAWSSMKYTYKHTILRTDLINIGMW